MPMPTPFGVLRPLEAALRDAVEQAVAETAPEAALDATGRPDRTLRGAFLAWILTVAVKDKPSLALLVLTGATIEGEVALSGLRIPITARFVDCRFRATVSLGDASVVGLEFLGGALETLTGDRLNASGSLILRARDPAQAVPIRVRRQIRLCGARIGGNLDLRRALIGAHDPQQPDLYAVFADGVSVGGNALLSERCTTFGDVRLNGCRIGRNLDCTAAHFRQRHRHSLSLIGAQVSGDLFMCKAQEWSLVPPRTPFRAEGVVELSGARIDGEVNCSGGSFIGRQRIGAGRLYAIKAPGLAVGGALRLRDGFHARGSVTLINAKLGADLYADGGSFDYSRRDALLADGASVAGAVFLDRGGGAQGGAPVRTTGFLRFEKATLRQGLYLDGVVFHPPAPAVAAAEDADDTERKGNCGFIAAAAEIGGTLAFRNIPAVAGDATEGVGIVVDLHDAKADVLSDDEESWRSVKVLDLAGFAYQGLAELGPNDTWRGALLEKQLAPWAPPGSRFTRWLSRLQDRDERIRRFEPGSYLWLAKIMRQSGYDDAATDLLILLERQRTRFGDYGPLWRLGRHILDVVTRYGYRPIYAFRVLLVWTAFSWWVFAGATIGPAGDIVDTKASANPPPSVPAAAYEEFHPFFLALDTVVPVVDLHQKSRFEIKMPSLRRWRSDWRETGGAPQGSIAHVGRALRQFLVPLLGFANLFIAWTLGGLFAAGVTGWLRRGNGDG